METAQCGLRAQALEQPLLEWISPMITTSPNSENQTLHSDFSKVLGNVEFFSREEELALFRRYRKGDSEAHELLVRSVTPMVMRLAMKYCRQYFWNDLEGAESAALEGVLRAIEKFDPKRGTRLITYAGWWTRSFLNKHHHEDRTIRVPHAYKQGPYSEAGERARTVLALDEYSAQNLEQPQRKGDFSELQLEALEQALLSLPEKLRWVLRERFWAQRTLWDVGMELGVTRERVRQLEVEGIQELRRLLKRPA